MRPKLPVPRPLPKRHHANFFKAVDSFFYVVVVGMMATLSVAGGGALCENGKMAGDLLFGARSDSGTHDMNAVQPAASVAIMSVQ